MPLHLALGIWGWAREVLLGWSSVNLRYRLYSTKVRDGCVIVLEAARCWVVWCAIETLYVCGKEDMMSGGLMH